jgi:YbbR domain-containing protein
MIKNFLTELFTENLSYKAVSLFVAFVLWVTILGRRDFAISKSMEVEVVSQSNQVVLSQSVDSIRVKLNGPRNAIKRLSDSNFTSLVFVDIRDKGFGEIEVPVQTDKLDLPMGVKVLSVRPTSIKVVVKKKEEL